jgi:hypothetical protein
VAELGAGLEPSADHIGAGAWIRTRPWLRHGKGGLPTAQRLKRRSLREKQVAVPEPWLRQGVWPVFVLRGEEAWPLWTAVCVPAIFPPQLGRIQRLGHGQGRAPGELSVHIVAICFTARWVSILADIDALATAGGLSHTFRYQMVFSLVALLVAGFGVHIDRSSEIRVLSGETKPLVAPRALVAFPSGRWLEIVTGRATIDASCLPASVWSQRDSVLLIRDFIEGADTPFTFTSFWSEGPSGLIASCGGTGAARFLDTRRIQIPFEQDQMLWNQNYAEQSLQTEGEFATGVSLVLPAGRFAILSSAQFQALSSQPISFRLRTATALYQPVGSARLTLPQLQTIDFLTEVTGPTTVELQVSGGTATDSVEVRELRIFAIPSTAFETVQVKETAAAEGVSAAVRVDSTTVPRPGRYVLWQLLRIEGTDYQATLSNPTSSFSVQRESPRPVFASDVAVAEVIDVLPASGPRLEFKTELASANLAAVKSEVSRLLLGPFDLPPELSDGGRDFIGVDSTSDAGAEVGDGGCNCQMSNGVSLFDGGQPETMLEFEDGKALRARSEFQVGCGCNTDGRALLCVVSCWALWRTRKKHRA